ncbi:MAG: hypothetical protein PHX13_04385 [Thiovulaceae bacterium]|nr:hypothetical protein [Sulfurimonadaceae bacterium]
MSTTINNSSNIPITASIDTTASSTPSTTTDGTSFADALAAASSTAPTLSSLLTTSTDSSAHRPNMKQFMDATGVSESDASELLYGVVGSNTDTRNWNAIMSSSDPITTARNATAQMYDNNTPNSDPTTNINTQSNGLIAQSGDFALQQTLNSDGTINHTGIDLVDNTGTILRNAGSTPDKIQHNAWLFGLDLNQASSLVQQTKQLSSPLGDALSQAIIQTNALDTQTSDSSQTTDTTTTLDQAQATIANDTTTAIPTVDSITTQINQLSGTLAKSTPTNLNSYLSLINQIQTLTTQLQALQASSVNTDPNALVS